MYLEANLFIKAPEIAIQGTMEHVARASRQLHMNAKMKPVKKDAVELTTRGTFSDMP